MAGSTPSRGGTGEPEDLRRFLGFQHFADTELKLLAPLGLRLACKPGHEIVTEGDAGCDFFIVLAGAVTMSCMASSAPIGVGALRSGAVFGEVSFIDGGVRPTTVAAKQESLLLQFSEAAVRDLLRAEVGVRVALLRTFWHALAIKTRLANRAMLSVMSGTSDFPRKRHGGSSPGTSTTVVAADKVKLFRDQGLHAAELRLLAATLPARRYAANEVIFAEGQDADALFIVVNGAVRISRRIGESGEEALAFVAPGESFGELALIDDQRRSADATVHGDGCTVLVVSKSDFQDIVDVRSHASAQFMEPFCTLLARRLREMLSLLVKWRILSERFGSSPP